MYLCTHIAHVASVHTVTDIMKKLYTHNIIDILAIDIMIVIIDL